MAVSLAKPKTNLLPTAIGRASAQTPQVLAQPIAQPVVQPVATNRTYAASQPAGLSMPQAPQPTQVQPQTGANQLDFSQRLAQAYASYNQAATPLPQIDIAKQTGMVENQYAQRQKAIQERQNLATQQGVANLEQQRAKALPQYELQRQQSEVQTEQGRQRMAEQLAAQGLGASGRAVTQNAQLESGRVKSLANINSQQQQFVNDIDFQINQLRDKGVSETNAQLADLEAQKTQALIDVDNRNNEMLLKLYSLQNEQQRQQLQDKINQIEFDYKDNQAKIDQAFKEKQFTEQQKQQALDNAYRDKQFAQQKAMEEANLSLAREKFGFEKQQAEQQLALQRESMYRSGSSGGGGGSSSGGGGGEEFNVNDYVAQAVINAQDTNNPKATIQSMKNDMINDVGAAAYQKAYNQVKDLPVKKEKTTTNTNQQSSSGGALGWIKSKWNSVVNYFSQ